MAFHAVVVLAFDLYLNHAKLTVLDMNILVQIFRILCLLTNNAFIKVAKSGMIFSTRSHLQRDAQNNCPVNFYLSKEIVYSHFVHFFDDGTKLKTLPEI